MSNGFVKLKNSELDSSLWCQPVETILTWVTLILSADGRGICLLDGAALAERARVSVEGCARALQFLSCPDSEGPSGHDGRRIERSELGWRVLEFAERLAPSWLNDGSSRSLGHLDEELARAVAAGARCAYCPRKLTMDRMSRSGATWDHVIPWVQGGGNDRTNLVLACRSCNSRKGGRTPEQAGMVLR